MKKFFLIPWMVFLSFNLAAQPVSEYLYKYDNGITIKKENTWSQVWVQQSYSPLTAGDQNPLAVNVRSLGDLISGSSYVLMNDGKEIKLKGIAPGNYDLKMTFKLSGKPGTLSFVVGNVAIKPKTKTSVSITLYDYQIYIEENPVASSGQSAFETEVHRCKISTVQDNLVGTPSFYASGDRSKPLLTSGGGKTKGTIKPGTYDVLLTIDLSGQNHRIWIENLQMKPGTGYNIYTNMNAGGIIYSGTNREIKSMHLYPAGTAAKQTGTPAPVKNLEIISYTKISDLNCCAPGMFDILLGTGNKYEWRKNIAVNTGLRTDIK